MILLLLLLLCFLDGCGGSPRRDFDISRARVPIRFVQQYIIRVAMFI